MDTESEISKLIMKYYSYPVNRAFFVTVETLHMTKSLQHAISSKLEGKALTSKQQRWFTLCTLYSHDEVIEFSITEFTAETRTARQKH